MIKDRTIEWKESGGMIANVQLTPDELALVISALCSQHMDKLSQDLVRSLQKTIETMDAWRDLTERQKAVAYNDNEPLG